MPNLFLLSHGLGSEDHLTASWAYVLHNVPGLGQAFVDHVARRAELPHATLHGLWHQPTEDRRQRPDIRLTCDSYDLYCEHKLASGLGPQQLERYLTLCNEKHKKLLLITASTIEIPTSVLSSPAYVCPRDGSPALHFLWQDVFSLLSEFSHPLVRDFAEYLIELGVAGTRWGDLGDPFIDRRAAEALRELYQGLAPTFKAPGVVLRTRSNSLIFEIRKPFRPIHLINVGPLRSVSDPNPEPPVVGRVMALWVWVQRPPGREEVPILPAKWRHGRTAMTYASIPRCSPKVYVFSTDGYYRGPPAMFEERVYYAGLDTVLLPSIRASRNALRQFVIAATDHLRDEVEAGGLDE